MNETTIALLFAGGSTTAAFVVPLSLNWYQKRREEAQRRVRTKNIFKMVIAELAGIVPTLKAHEQCREACFTASSMEELKKLSYRLIPPITPILDRIVDWIGDIEEHYTSSFAEVYALIVQYRNSINDVFSTPSLVIARYRFERAGKIKKGLLQTIFALVKKFSKSLPDIAPAFIQDLEAELSTHRVHTMSSAEDAEEHR